MYNRSVYFWFGLVFFLFFTFRIVDGIFQCEATDWATCPGQFEDEESEDNE